MNSSATIQDGTAYWTWVGPTETPYSGEPVPSYSLGTTLPSDLTNFWLPVPNAGVFRAYGSSPVSYNTNYWQLNVLNPNPSSTWTMHGERVCTMLDSTRVAFPLLTSATVSGAGRLSVRFIVDGRYYNQGGTPFLAGTVNYAVFDFGTASKHLHSVCVEAFDQNVNGLTQTFYGAVTPATGTLTAPTANDDVRAVFIDNSLSDGSTYGPYTPGHTVPNIVSKELGWSDPFHFGIGGTGYCAPGTGPFYTYVERLSQALALKPDVIFGGDAINDQVGCPATIQTSAASFISTARAGGFKGPIIMMGTWSRQVFGGSNDDANVVASENAVKAAVTAAQNTGDKLVFFIPVRTDPNGPWIRGVNNGYGASTINSPLWIAADGTHPTEAGTRLRAERIVQAIKNIVLTSAALQ